MADRSAGGVYCVGPEGAFFGRGFAGDWVYGWISPEPQLLLVVFYVAKDGRISLHGQPVSFGGNIEN